LTTPRTGLLGSLSDPRLPSGVLACVSLLVAGWTLTLFPSLIRSVKEAFGQTDAGIGLAYMAYALAYAAGSFGGGVLIERAGRRRVMAGAALANAIGLAGLGLAPTWAVFLAAVMTSGLGAGALEGGANGLVLDAYRSARGRAMSLLHVSFGIGAFGAPLVVALFLGLDVPWQSVAAGSGVVVVALALGYWTIPVPSGRRTHVAAMPRAAARGGRRRPDMLGGPMLLLGTAIAAYVAAEVGVANWLVRFLEPAPLATATAALSLFWVGLTLGRLVSAAIIDRLDHRRSTIVCALAMAAAIAVAVLVPSLPISIAAFALAGLAAGPIFPTILAIGGDHFPDRSAAVGGSLAGMAVLGSTIYPPAMGLMSVTVGLGVAMFGSAVAAVVCAVALVALGARTGAGSRLTAG